MATFRWRTQRESSQQEALARFLANGDAHPTPVPIDWDAEKDSLDRESLRDLP